MKPLRSSQTLQERVADAIKNYIIENRMREGDRLPSEHQMAAMLNVSRASVREALATLAALGMVDIKVGRGAFVRDFDLRTITDQLPYGLQFHRDDLEELVEIRRLLEVYAIRNVVETIDEVGVARLRAVVDRMGEKAQRGADFVEEDIEFHRILAQIAGKRVLSFILNGFWELQMRTRSGVADPERLRLRYEEHRRIFDAVAARDLEGAVTAMEQHFDTMLKGIASARSEQGAKAREVVDRERSGL